MGDCFCQFALSQEVTQPSKIFFSNDLAVDYELIVSLFRVHCRRKSFSATSSQKALRKAANGKRPDRFL
jgi:hypothetical protein